MHRPFPQWTNTDILRWTKKRWHELRDEPWQVAKLVAAYSRLGALRKQHEVSTICLALERGFRSGWHFWGCVSDKGFDLLLAKHLTEFEQHWPDYAFLAKIDPAVKNEVLELEDLLTADLPNPADEERIAVLKTDLAAYFVGDSS